MLTYTQILQGFLAAIELEAQAKLLRLLTMS
jgi:hypothetical protein